MPMTLADYEAEDAARTNRVADTRGILDQTGMAGIGSNQTYQTAANPNGWNPAAVPGTPEYEAEKAKSTGILADAMTKKQPTDYTSEINGLYKNFLGRDGRADELDWWNKNYEASGGASGLSGLIGGSAEALAYKNRNAATTTEQTGGGSKSYSDPGRKATISDEALNAAYMSTYGRPADAAGATWWKTEVAEGRMTPEQVIERIKSEGSALGDDQKAYSQIASGAADPTKTWGAGASLDNLVWNEKTNSWIPDPKVTPVTPTPTPTPTPDPVATRVDNTPAPAQQIQTPAPLAVDQPTMTVQGQMQNLMDPNNPLNQKVRTNVMEGMNARGIINSSIAETAAQDAMLGQAESIAKADAATYYDAGKTNNQNAVQFARDNNLTVYDLQKMAKQQGYDLEKMSTQQIYDLVKMSTAQQYTQANMALQQSFTQANMSLAQQNDLQKLSVQNGFDLNKMDKQAAINLGMLSAQTQQDLVKMAKAQGYNLETMSVSQQNDLAKMSKTQEYVQSNMGLQQNFDITKMDKAAAITLSQMSQQQINDLSKMATAQGYNLQNMSAQQVNDLTKMSTAQNYVKENMGLQNSFDITKMDKAAAITLSQMDKQQINVLSQMATSQGYTVQNMSSQQVNAMAQIGANATNSQKLAAMNIDATKALNLDNQAFTRLTTNSNAAVNVLSTLERTLTGIDLNSDGMFDAATKSTMKANAITAAKDSLDLIGRNSNDPDLQAYIKSLFPKP